MKVYTFEVGKHTPPETWAQEGKPEMANYIQVSVSRYKAWQLVHELLQQLQNAGSDQDTLTIPLMGGELREQP